MDTDRILWDTSVNFINKPLLSDSKMSGRLEIIIVGTDTGGSSQQKDNYEFGNGCFHYSIEGDFPMEEKVMLASLRGLLQGGYGKGILTATAAISENLKAETSLDPSEDRIMPFFHSARHTLDWIFSQRGGNIAMPIPNWPGFWSLEGLGRGDYSFEYFHAHNQDQLVENFEHATKKGDISGLLLVNPANPLGYIIDADHAGQLSETADKYGVQVIIDDLLRGNMPIGQRESIGVYFSNPIIVEGMSHRWGESPLGFISYMHMPDNIVVKRKDIGPSLIGPYLLSAEKYSKEKIVQLLTERNRQLDLGLAGNGVNITRPSMSSITSVVELPNGFPDATQFCIHAYHNGVLVAPMAGYYPDDRVPPGAKPGFRVAIGTTDAEKVYKGASLLRTLIQEYQ